MEDVKGYTRSVSDEEFRYLIHGTSPEEPNKILALSSPAQDVKPITVSDVMSLPSKEHISDGAAPTGS